MIALDDTFFTGAFVGALTTGLVFLSGIFAFVEGKRSAAAQPGLPSATGSASDATSVHEWSCVTVASEVSNPSNTGKEDGPGADSSVVQLPVSGSAALKKRIAELEKECNAMEDLLILKGQGVASWRMSDATCGLHKTLSCWNNAIEWNDEQAADAPSAAGASGGS